MKVHDDQKKTKFLELLQTEKPRRAGKYSAANEILPTMKEEIQKARSMGFGFKQISEFLKRVGVGSIGPSSIKKFCIDALGEPVPLTKKKKRKNTKVLQPKKQLTKKVLVQEKTKSKLNPDFRIAGDDL